MLATMHRGRNAIFKRAKNFDEVAGLKVDRRSASIRVERMRWWYGYRYRVSRIIWKAEL